MIFWCEPPLSTANNSYRQNAHHAFLSFLICYLLNAYSPPPPPGNPRAVNAFSLQNAGHCCSLKVVLPLTSI